MIDHIQQILDQAKNNIKKENAYLLDEQRIIPILKDGRKGVPEYAPYDLIHLGGTVEIMPQEIVAQLAPGGAIWAPVGPKNGSQQIKLYKKDQNGTLTITSVLPVRYGSLGSVEE
jgi:protein-L-isoaspartate(D-aspartate) O-methyltransferase